MKYYELTKDQIKAIRIIKGYNPDLRVRIKMSYDQILRTRTMIKDNRDGFLESSTLLEMMKMTDEQREKVYDSFVFQVAMGKEDDEKAYDLAKVLEQLYRISDEAEDKISVCKKGYELYHDGFSDGVDEAIEIVKGGVVDEKHNNGINYPINAG